MRHLTLTIYGTGRAGTQHRTTRSRTVCGSQEYGLPGKQHELSTPTTTTLESKGPVHSQATRGATGEKRRHQYTRRSLLCWQNCTLAILELQNLQPTGCEPTRRFHPVSPRPRSQLVLAWRKFFKEATSDGGQRRDSATHFRSCEGVRWVRT